MTTLRPLQLVNLAILRSIEPKRLMAFLVCYETYFTGRGLPPPSSNAGHKLDYGKLIEILSTPNIDTPAPLLTALYLIDEMSTPRGMEQLLQTGIREETGVTDFASPADVAVQVWLLHPQILENLHAQQFLEQDRPFEDFQTKSEEPPTFEMPTVASHRQLEQDMDDWFDTGPGGWATRVFIYPRENGADFLIRHGLPDHHHKSSGDGQAGNDHDRPLRYDMVIYDQQLGGLRIAAATKGQQQLYRRLFGKYLFGDEGCFPETSRYTLEPLRQYGPASMSCGDVDGIESVTLQEVQLLIGGSQKEIQIRRASDLFAAMAERQRYLPQQPRLIKAVMKVKFSDSAQPRSLTIRPPNVIRYERDADAEILEPWLLQRGFIMEVETGAK